MKRTLIHTVLGLLLLGVVAVAPGAPQQQLPYQNPSLSVEERVEDLLGRMTVQEKVLQLASFFPNANVRLGIPHMQAGEALHGVTLGQETGTAVAEALFGEINPGGKLPVTIPRNVGQVPINYNMLAWGRPGRYFESAAEPLWPFGHGLSYTTFEYSNLRVAPGSGSSTLATATIDVTNTGARTGDEIVQLYVKDEYASVVRPAMELKRFRRITLSPGETRAVAFSLDESAFAFYDEKTKSWIVEPGAFDIMIGSSSRDIRATTKIEL